MPITETHFKRCNPAPGGGIFGCLVISKGRFPAVGKHISLIKAGSLMEGNADKSSRAILAKLLVHGVRPCIDRAQVFDPVVRLYTVRVINQVWPFPMKKRVGDTVRKKVTPQGVTYQVSLTVPGDKGRAPRRAACDGARFRVICEYLAQVFNHATSYHKLGET